MTRRDIIRDSMVVGAAAAAFGQAPAGTEQVADKPLRVGLIGCGWYGKVDLFRLLQVSPVEVVSVCDVDQRLVREAAEQIAGRQASGASPRQYGDYREMLAPRDLDLVIVGTPDHWHALPMIAAVEAGADVYVQKPTGVDVAECQAMVAAARAHNRVVQVGLQRRSTPHLVEAKRDLIDTGKLGEVGMAEIYSYYHMRSRANPPVIEPPAELDWNMYCGPAPLRPYTEGIHPRGWRAYSEFGNGIIGDMGVHMLDMVRWMLGLGWPLSVSSSAGTYFGSGAANISDTQTATFDFGDRQILWQHRTWGAPADNEYPWGATLYGQQGTLRAGVFGYDFKPNRDGEAVHREVAYELDEYPADRDEKDLERHVAPAIRAHLRNWLECRATRAKPVSDIEEGAISSACCILANLSAELGRTLHWDPTTWRVRDDDEANSRLARPYRAPWRHPGTA